MRKLLTLQGICGSVFNVHGRVTLHEKGRRGLTALHGFIDFLHGFFSNSNQRYHLARGMRQEGMDSMRKENTWDVIT